MSDIAIKAAQKIVTHTQILKQPHPEWRKKEVETIAAIIDAELASVAGWQPIDSAPKDSTWILGLTQANRYVVVRWGGGAWEDDNRLCRDPKHWQPLPALPKE